MLTPIGLCLSKRTQVTWNSAVTSTLLNEAAVEYRTLTLPQYLW